MANEECDQHVLSLFLCLTLSVYRVVFTMFLFAIFIVWTYPDLLNTYAPMNSGVMQKYRKSGYRPTLRFGSYFSKTFKWSTQVL
jgi:hypothetical protein